MFRLFKIYFILFSNLGALFALNYDTLVLLEFENISRSKSSDYLRHVLPDIIKDYNLDDFTLELALKLLKYPYIIGTYEDKDIILDKGRFGLYIKYDSKNFSYKIEDESRIDLESIIEFIKIKSSTTNSNGVIKKLNDKITIIN